MAYYWPENWLADRIDIYPKSYDKEQRMEASTLATAQGKGLVMELHSAHTEFYADARVPVGKVEIYSPAWYGAQPEYVTTLDRAEDDWEPDA